MLFGAVGGNHEVGGAWFWLLAVWEGAHEEWEVWSESLGIKQESGLRGLSIAWSSVSKASLEILSLSLFSFLFTEMDFSVRLAQDI
jgi:hypothetical protein